MRVSRQRLSISTLTAVVLLPAAAVIIGIGTAGAAATCARVPSDFNGDGHADVAVGEPFRNVGPVQFAGVLRVLYGGSSGVTVAGNKLYEESSLPVGTPGDNDTFGWKTVSGYFNSDCYADLAVTAPIESPSAVYILFGSANGLVTSSAQKFTATQLDGQNNGNDQFNSLAVGDFNGDGHSDLALGIPQANDPGGAEVSGGVGVLYGTASGLSLSGKTFITESSPGVPGSSLPDDGFGNSVAAGDFTGDGRTDLAVGGPEVRAGKIRAGTVTILPGSASGVTGIGSKVWSEDTPGVPGVVEDLDRFGFVIAAGDVTGDGRPDLVIGALDESIGSAVLCGAITFLRNSASGLTATGSQSWSQNSPGVPGTAERLDQFGAQLAIGDFNGDGHADVAVGVPGEDVGAVKDAGAVNVFYGASSGLTSAHAQSWSQDSPGVPGVSEDSDMFGTSLLALQVRSTGRADLIVGIPQESTGALAGNGAIETLYGGAAGLTSTGSQSIDATVLVGGAQNFGSFGFVGPDAN